MIDISARSISAINRGAFEGLTGYGRRMSSMPASAKTSASPIFAQQTPIAPRSICHPATLGDLWVLA
jgi:hypothetical protein